MRIVKTKFLNVMANLNFEIKSKANGVIILELQNKGVSPVSLSRDSILLDGFTSNKFQITDLADQSKLEYQGRSVKYKPEKFWLEAGSKVSSELDLLEVYFLESCHTYDVNFRNSIIADNEIVKISGSVNLTTMCDN